MSRFKFFLTIFFLFSLLFSFLHIYISFFKNDVCFWNTGVVFGIADFLNPYILSFFLLLVLIVLILLLYKQFSAYWQLLFVLGISSLTNIFDRLVHGGVCDYIRLGKSFNFPIFNFNDILISMALVFILILIFYEGVYCEKKGCGGED